MATLATQSIVRAGLTATYSAAAGGGDKMTPGRRNFLHVKNASGGSITVTLAAQHTPGGYSGLALGNLAVAVAAGAEKFIGPVLPDVFAATADGLAVITYSGVTSLTVAAVELSEP